jgi:hypothetical protein
MNKDIVLPVLGLVVASMTIWIRFAIDPSWAGATRKKILVLLFSLYTAFSFYVITAFGPDRFETQRLQWAFESVVFINWMLLIIRVYQLWPRRGE